MIYTHDLATYDSSNMAFLSFSVCMCVCKLACVLVRKFSIETWSYSTWNIILLRTVIYISLDLLSIVNLLILNNTFSLCRVYSVLLLLIIKSSHLSQHSPWVNFHKDYMKLILKVDDCWLSKEFMKFSVW